MAIRKLDGMLIDTGGEPLKGWTSRHGPRRVRRVSTAQEWPHYRGYVAVYPDGSFTTMTAFRDVDVDGKRCGLDPIDACWDISYQHWPAEEAAGVRALFAEWALDHILASGHRRDDGEDGEDDGDVLERARDRIARLATPEQDDGSDGLENEEDDDGGE